jgi:hypothetical protein
METTTVRLTNVLKSGKDIHRILQENESAITAPTLREHLEKLLHSKGLKRQDVISRAELDGNYVNQLFSGIKTKPGREHTLSLAFGFGLDKEETDRLLKVAGAGALYPKNKRDAVLIHSLENGKSVKETNEVLISLELGDLSNRGA